MWAGVETFFRKPTSMKKGVVDDDGGSSQAGLF